ncbi:GNAT family N-acetyltransferase [Cereibacter changlensis]|uniref:GNAT family N-acetyltransferase n=1 Tax=Cereibacter changlensis TaxID=402884 RepID=UPI0040332525
MKNQTVVIRPFDAATDIEKLSAIWLDASRLAHPFMGEQRLLQQRKLIEEEYLPKAETWVACRAGEALGFISLLDSFIGGIFISPDQQGQGIGRRLIAHALSLKGELSLEVYTRNEQAFGFYRMLGFREVSRRPNDDNGLPFENAHLRLKG